jgi:transposase-like protein
MSLLLTLILAIDLAGIKSEPKLEKRSELALQYADASIDAARDAYRKGDLDASRAALGEVEAGVQLSYDSLMATGKDARRNSRPFKEAEKATRQILRRLDSLSDLMSALDRSAVEPAQHAVSDIHDKLITGIMGKKK